MKTTDRGTFTELEADEGKALTQAVLEEGEERIYIKKVATTHPENWIEITLQP